MNIKNIKRVLLAALIGLTTPELVHAQSLQWADTVLDFSSQLSPVVYSAQQILGEPNVAEKEGDSPNAWAPAKPNQKEFIVVGFAQPTRIQQIAIHESFNPGAIDEVYAIDMNGQPELLYDFEPGPKSAVSRMFNIFFPLTAYDVYAIEIVIDGASVEGLNCIDAIAVSNSNVPIQINIPVKQNANPDIESTRLGPNINSEYNEVGPVVAPDGKTLYFSRFNHPENIGGVDDEEDIWYAEWDDDSKTWLPARNIGPPLNNKDANYVNSASTEGDGVGLLLGNEYTKNGKVKPGLSLAHQSDSGWTLPEAVKIKNFYNLSTLSEFDLSNDETILLSSIEREDSYGLVDLYVSFKDSTGIWTEPLNLGPIINTAHEEISPNLLEDNKTLFFSSAGFGGYGGQDIMVTERLDDTWTNWSKPQNMGPGLNTEADEVHLSLHEGSSMGFFAREVNGNSDIFQINKDELFIPPKTSIIASFQAFDAKTRKPITANFKIEQETSRSTYSTIASNNGQSDYSIELKFGSTFKVTIDGDGYYPETILIDLEDGDHNSEDETYQVQLQPEPPKEIVENIKVDDITFQLNSSFLSKASTEMIKNLSKELVNKTIKAIELSGHTDASGDEDYNMWLSERRTLRIRDAFVQNGVPAEFIQMKWFGEAMPKYDNNIPGEASKNRRVEVRIVQ